MPLKAVLTSYKSVKIGGPPDDWDKLLVVDLDTGNVIRNLQEVDIEIGILKRLSDKLPENLEEWPIETIQGNFEIRRIVDVGETDYVTKTEEDSTG